MRRLGKTGLGYGQTFVLIFGFLITSALIFLFGIWVGRDVAERRLAQEERVVRVSIPVQPTPRDEASEHGVDLAFYEQLKEKAVQRLQQTAAASSPTPTRPVAAAPPPATPRRGSVKPTPRSTPSHVKGPVPPAAGDEWADAGWTVQVNATTNADEARELVSKLRARSYDAYLVPAPMQGQMWYRVRVGRVTSREKAKELEDRLKSSEGLSAAFVTPR